MANRTILELPETTNPLYLAGTDPDGIASKTTVAQAVANEYDKLGVPELVHAAQESAFDAAEFAEQALQRASAPKDTLLPDGSYSGLHYQSKTADYARAAALLPEKIIDGTVSSPYTLIESDKFRRLVFTGSTALTVICPQNLHLDPAIDGSPSEAWVSALRIGSGLITFTGEATTVVLTPTVLARDNFVFNTSVEPPPATVGSHSIVVPAGTNRKISFQLFAIHKSTKAGRNSTLTATNTSSLTKVTSDTSTVGSGGTNPIPVAQWAATMADSDTTTTVAITVTPDADPYSYALIVTAIGNCAALTGAVAVSGSTNATTVTRDVTTTIDKSLIVGALAMFGGDTTPVTLGGPGTQRFNGRTGSRGAKDLSYIGFEYLANTAGLFTHTLTSDLSDRGSSCALIATPNTGTLVASTLLAPDGTTLSAAGKCCTIWMRSDGRSYIKES